MPTGGMFLCPALNKVVVYVQLLSPNSSIPLSHSPTNPFYLHHPCKFSCTCAMFERVSKYKTTLHMSTKAMAEHHQRSSISTPSFLTSSNGTNLSWWNRHSRGMQVERCLVQVSSALLMMNFTLCCTHIIIYILIRFHNSPTFYCEDVYTFHFILFLM